MFLQTKILITTMFLFKDLGLTFYYFFPMRVLWVLLTSFLLFAWLTSSFFYTSLRALLLVVLKCHITIFNTTNYKNEVALVELKPYSLFFFFFLIYSPPLPQISFTHFEFFLKLPFSHSFLNPTYNGTSMCFFIIFVLASLFRELAPYLEHSHPAFTKNSILLPQKLPYHLYYIILLHT